VPRSAGAGAGVPGPTNGLLEILSRFLRRGVVVVIGGVRQAGRRCGATPTRIRSADNLIDRRDWSASPVKRWSGDRARRVAVGRWLRAAALFVLALVGCLGFLAPPAAAAGGAASRYSDPVHWPLRVAARVDCTMHNSGCPKHHQFWGVDVVPVGQRLGRPASHAGVYAMGAGVAHVGEAHGKPCGWGGVTDFGTWIWIDHGGGLVSRYGHLSAISVREGQYVPVGGRLGTIGNTGDGSKLYCDENYVDFQVRRGGIRGPSVPFSTSGAGAPDGQLLACEPKGMQVWPRDLGHGVKRIDDLPKASFVPASTDGCPPVTARWASATPLWLGMAVGEDSLGLSWSGVPTATDEVRVELGRYQRGSARWDEPWHERWRATRASRSVMFHGLDDSSRYRMRLWLHTATGWAAPSNWFVGRPD